MALPHSLFQTVSLGSSVNRSNPFFLTLGESWVETLCLA
jgi:hypothetical protein